MSALNQPASNMRVLGLLSQIANDKGEVEWAVIMPGKDMLVLPLDMAPDEMGPVIEQAEHSGLCEVIGIIMEVDEAHTP